MCIFAGEIMKVYKQWMIATILIICGLPLLLSCSKDDTGDEQPPQKVTRWECILFGSYPANEVVSGSFNAVDDYALADGDVITDALLYHQLEQAEWTDDDTEIGGKRYHRLNGSGAVTCSTNREQHYRWSNTDDWHYFAYAPIKWRILKISGTKAVLLADRMPDTSGSGIDDAARRFRSSLYAKCRGAWWSSVTGYRGNSFWFMRTNGYTPSSITYICDFGYLYNQGTAITCDDAAVLPALTIDLTKASWTVATPVMSTDIVQ